MVTQRPVRPRAYEGEEQIPPLELSTNPVVRQVFRDELDNSVGRKVFSLSEEDVVIENLPEGQDHQPCLNAMPKERAVQRALAFLLFIQVPAGVLSLWASPTVEWELIAACFIGLLILKVCAAKRPSQWSVVLGAVTANVLMGALVGEVIHFFGELTMAAIDLPYLAATVVAILFAAAFYVCLICDVLYVRKARRIKLRVHERDGKVVISEHLVPLTSRDEWWLTWGLSAGSVWAPFHALYLASRFVDWLTAGVFLEVIWRLMFNRGFRL